MSHPVPAGMTSSTALLARSWLRSLRSLLRGTASPNGRPLPGRSLPPFRRKPLLEALEPRLLLSGTPLGIVGADAFLRLALDDAAENVVVQQVAANADGSVILAVPVDGGLAERFGSAASGIKGL